VHRIRVSTLVTAIHVAPVRQQTMQNHHRAGGHLEGNEIAGNVGQRRRVENFEGRTIVGGVANELFAKGGSMPAGQGPEASVLVAWRPRWRTRIR